MKIDFLGSFSSIQESLRTKAESPSMPSDTHQKIFDQMLEERAAIQPSEPSYNSETDQHLSELDPREAMGRLSLELAKPQLTESELEPVLPSSVKQPSEDVTPPTIVSVRRYDTPAEFDQLPHPDRMAEVERLIHSAKQDQKSEVPVPLAMAVISTESAFRAQSVSRDGHSTKGLFQFLDSTGKEILSQLDSSARYKPMNPEQNVSLGVRYLNYLNEIFSRPTSLTKNIQTVDANDEISRKKLTLAAFNAGEGRVAAAQARAREARLDPGNYDDISRFLPKSTRNYVNKVVSLEREFVTARTSTPSLTTE